MDSELSRFPTDCRRPDLGERLVHFDEATPAARAELEAHAASCPACGRALRRLRQAQAWLEAQAGPLSACPSANELFDYGQGPGALALADERRREIDEHVDRCAECKGFVATLAARPPVPLDLAGDAEDRAAAVPEPATADAAGGLRPARPTPRLWHLPVWATAAALLVAFGVWVGFGPGGARASDGLTFPALDVVRTAETARLVFPRGPVAWDPAAAAPLHRLQFELRPHEPAERFRVVLRRNDGSAFDAGEVVGEVVGDEPRLDGRALGELAPGHYTWTAWSVVGDLELPLGERDFELVEDELVLGERDALAAVAEPERSFRWLHWLVDHGFQTDARHVARSLPPSTERDEFLARQAER